MDSSSSSGPQPNGPPGPPIAQAPTPTTEMPGPWLPRLRSCILMLPPHSSIARPWDGADGGTSLPASGCTGRAGLLGIYGILVINKAARVVHGQVDLLEPVRPAVAVADLCARPALAQDHVGRVVAVALEQGRAHRVGVDRHAGRLEGGDPLCGEAAGDDHADVPEPLGVQRVADLPDQSRVHAGR